MDPISAIVAALIAGATEAARPTAVQVVKDAYSGFRSLIVRKFSKTSAPLQGVEEKPTSESRQKRVERRADRSGSGARLGKWQRRCSL
jgi:hypothetical protein